MWALKLTLSGIVVELKEFFEIATDLLEGPESVFSFWNGLGATSKLRPCFTSRSLMSPHTKHSPFTSDPLIYDVACELAEMHMDDVGLKVRSIISVDGAQTADWAHRYFPKPRLNGTLCWWMMLQQKRHGRASSGFTGICPSIGFPLRPTRCDDEHVDCRNCKLQQRII